MATQSAAPVHLRVFVASPGDVADERGLALTVLEQLPYDPLLRGRVTLEAVAWDKPGAGTPMLATMTPQEAIARGLPKPSDCDIVVVIFWSRMGTPLSATWTRPDGSRYRSGTEWEFWDAVQASEKPGSGKPGKPAVLVYRRSEEPTFRPSDRDHEEKYQQWRQVEEFFALFREPGGSILRGMNPYATPDAFRHDLEVHLKQLIREVLEREPPPAVGHAVADPPLWKGSPFPGLRPFTADDAPIFFGRGRETDGLVRKLSEPAGRFIVVVGASGSGKSSLVAAGLLPRLRAGAVIGSRDWVPVRFTPGELGDDPFVALAARIAPLVERSGWRARDVTAKLRALPSELQDVVDRALDGRPDWAELLLFVDQFEELFTIGEPSHRDAFIELLAAAAGTPRVRTVATLRADFYERSVESPALAELLRGGSFPLAAPGVGALAEMITGPAARAGLIFEDGLMQRILDDTGREPGALTLMAFGLFELYRGRDPSGQLTHAAYEHVNGVQGAIAKRAEDTVNGLDPGVQDALPDVFRELVEVDERGISTRRRAALHRVSASTAAATLVDVLTDARLLVKGSAEGGAPVVEVTHEALFTRWPRLAAWIREEGEDLRLLRLVKLAAAEWQRQGRRDEFLWPTKRLAPAYALVERLRPELNEVERRFLLLLDSRGLLEELDDPVTTHIRRAAVGHRLAEIGDPRAGVGLRTDGLPDLVWCAVPGGAVTLENSDGRFRVEPFEITKYAITWAQYRAFGEARDGYASDRWWNETAHREERPGEQYTRVDNYPADNVSWYDAVAFCRWLGAREGREIRLPTEWEWQQAATGGDDTRVCPWGSEWDPGRANTEESGLNGSTAVGMYPHGASPVGALDLSGGVWEWCLNEYEHAERVELTGESPRVVRGGSWAYNRDRARTAYRDRDLPGFRNRDHGFRLARASV